MAGSAFDAILNNQVGMGQAKRARLSEIEQEKKQRLDPEWSKLDMDALEQVDGDTWRNRQTGEYFRLQGPQGKSPDTFETNLDYYKNNPERAEAHKRAYAEANGLEDGWFNKAWEQVSDEELVNAGKAQAQRNQSMFENANDLQYKAGGRDAAGRQLMEVRNGNGVSPDKSFEDQLYGRHGNASYWSDFNVGQQLEDITSGEWAEHKKGRRDRTVGELAGDTALAFGKGAANLGLSTVEAAAKYNPLNTMSKLAEKGYNALTGKESELGPSAFDRAVSNNIAKAKEAVEDTLNPLRSDVAKRNELDAERRAAYREETFKSRIDEMVADGESPTNARALAVIDDFNDTLKDVVRSPGRMVDMIAESAPSMIPVAAAGKATALIGMTGMKKVMKDKFIKESQEAGVGISKEMALKKANEFANSAQGKKILGRMTTASGVGAVGLTEAVSNASDVYNSIASMSETEAMESAQYQDLRNKGYSHDDAVHTLAEQAYETTFANTFAVAAATSGIVGTGAFQSRLATTLADTPKKSAKSLTGKVTAPARTALKEGAREALEELPQSAGGELITQKAQESVGYDQELGQGIGRAGAEGAASGMGMSTTTSAVSQAGKAAASAIGKTKETAKDVNKAIGEEFNNAFNKVESQPEPETVAAEKSTDAEIVNAVAKSDPDKIIKETDNVDLNSLSKAQLKARKEALVTKYHEVNTPFLELEEAFEQLGAKVIAEGPESLSEKEAKTYQSYLDITDGLNELAKKIEAVDSLITVNDKVVDDAITKLSSPDSERPVSDKEMNYAIELLSKRVKSQGMESLPEGTLEKLPENVQKYLNAISKTKDISAGRIEVATQKLSTGMDDKRPAVVTWSNQIDSAINKAVDEGDSTDTADKQIRGLIGFYEGQNEKIANYKADIKKLRDLPQGVSTKEAGLNIPVTEDTIGSPSGLANKYAEIVKDIEAEQAITKEIAEGHLGHYNEVFGKDKTFDSFLGDVKKSRKRNVNRKKQEARVNAEEQKKAESAVKEDLDVEAYLNEQNAAAAAEQEIPTAKPEPKPEPKPETKPVQKKQTSDEKSGQLVKNAIKGFKKQLGMVQPDGTVTNTLDLTPKELAQLSTKIGRVQSKTSNPDVKKGFQKAQDYIARRLKELNKGQKPKAKAESKPETASKGVELTKQPVTEESLAEVTGDFTDADMALEQALQAQQAETQAEPDITVEAQPAAQAKPVKPQSTPAPQTAPAAVDYENLTVKVGGQEISAIQEMETTTELLNSIDSILGQLSKKDCS